MKKYHVQFALVVIFLTGCSGLSKRMEEIFIDEIITENYLTTSYSIGPIEYSEQSEFPENWELRKGLSIESGFQEVWCVIVETGVYRDGNYPPRRYLPFVLSRKGDYWEAKNVVSKFYQGGPEKAFAILGCEYDSEKWDVGWEDEDANKEENEPMSPTITETNNISSEVLFFSEGYDSGNGGFTGVFYIYNLDGTHSQSIDLQGRIREDLSIYFVGHLSPDGEFLAFSGTKQCEEDGVGFTCESVIYIYELVTGELYQASEDNTFAWFGAWSPDSTKIVITLHTSNDSRISEEFRKSDDLYISNIDGSNRLKITDTPDEEVLGPKWAPDGSMIAYVLRSDDLYYPYLVNSTGNDQRIISEDFTPAKNSWALSQTGLHWSPNSKYLAFSNGKQKVAERESYLFDIEAGNLSKLTNEKGYLVLGWIDEKDVFAVEFKKGIVSINLEGDIDDLLKGSYNMYSVDLSYPYLIAANDDGNGSEFWDLSKNQLIANLAELFPEYGGFSIIP